MAKEERNRIRGAAPLVYEVDVELAMALDFYVLGKHGELVDLGLGLPPVESGLPVRRQPRDVSKGRAIFSSCTLQLVGEAGKLEFFLEELDRFVRYGEFEGLLSTGNIRHSGYGGRSAMRYHRTGSFMRWTFATWYSKRWEIGVGAVSSQPVAIW